MGKLINRCSCVSLSDYFNKGAESFFTSLTIDVSKRCRWPVRSHSLT